MENVYTIYVNCGTLYYSDISEDGSSEPTNDILLDYKTTPKNNYIIYSDYADGKSVNDEVNVKPFSETEKNNIIIDLFNKSYKLVLE